MFKSFNKSKIAVCLLLGINCLIAVTSTYLMLFNHNSAWNISYLSKVIITCFVVFANVYLIFYVYKRQAKALKLCAWFCLLSLVTIESELFSVGLIYGVKFGTVFEIGQAMVSINILALVTLFLLYRIINGQKKRVNA